MSIDSDVHHRRSIRLPEHDYALGGSYFITICTHNRELLFGEVVHGEKRTNEVGDIVLNEWARSADLRPTISLDAFVVMPNHVHGLLTFLAILDGLGAHSCAPLPDELPRRAPRSLASFVAQFKATVTRRINVLRNSPGVRFWQRNYYERIIRNEDEFERVRWYIEDNPRKWSEDEYNPAKAT